MQQVRMSLSSRRAWIEIIFGSGDYEFITSRSPHGERGLKLLLYLRRKPQHKVALLTESVDWNNTSCSSNSFTIVALLTESVDWNDTDWRLFDYCAGVALLTESVDWNGQIFVTYPLEESRSPHGERGLKLCLTSYSISPRMVALLTESVDWNINLRTNLMPTDSRSPHGERGLK